MVAIALMSQSSSLNQHNESIYKEYLKFIDIKLLIDVSMISHLNIRNELVFVIRSDEDLIVYAFRCFQVRN